MGVKTYECHTESVPWSAPFISAIHFAIVQESDFQPQNDFLLLSSFNHHLLLFPNLVWNLYYLSRVTGYYAIYYMALKRPI